MSKFNIFLERRNDHGIVVVDRLPDGREFDHLVEQFSHGLRFEDGSVVALDRIKLFASSCINASHMSSVVDIALGSFRYCINAPANVVAARAMLKNVTKMLWCVRDGETIHAYEMGLILRPRDVFKAEFKARYAGLLAHINALLKDVPAE